MAHSKETRAAVRKLYIETGKSLKTIARQCGIAYATVQAWKKKAEEQHDDWGVAKASYRISAGGMEAVNAMIIDDFTRMYQETIASVGGMSDVEKVKAVAMLADAYTKFVSATAKAQPKFAKIGIALDTLKMVLDGIRTHEPDLFERVAAVLESVSEQVQGKYGN